QLGCVVVFESGEDSTATLTGFTITNGLSETDSLRGGGITCINSSSPRLTDLIVENNEIVGDDEVYGGGGIYCLRQSSPNIVNVVIRENKARYCYGTGIYCKDSSNISLVNVVISDNEYTFRGGGIAIVNSRLTINKSQIVNNIAKYGGGIFLENSFIQIDSSKINQNVARSNGRGGGIWASASNISMKNSDISYNSAIFVYSSLTSFMSEGGGLYLRDCSVIMRNCNISYNISENNGGGFAIHNGAVEIYSTSINNNGAVLARASGGGMYIVVLLGTSIYLEDVVISDNYSYGSGGGIAYGADEINEPFKNVVIKNNSAEEKGGGIAATGNLVITESSGCSIFSNKAKEEGSDIYMNLLDSNSTYEIHLDTVTVSEPEDYHIYPMQNINFQYNHAIFQSVDSDLYVSPTGSDSNNGTSKDESLKTIRFALLVASADSINHRTIHLANGIYSPTASGEEFPLYGRSYVTLSGDDVNTTILDGEGKSRIIEISDIKNTVFENMTVQ
ncbi:MAG: right-handed parallel beta-helix repeat-containing protein, partial [Melioribacteraceae bacterium]|nr:right-handed parallel beta-helix repeat-containing protein [Melioribacteraceae bacterium]